MLRALLSRGGLVVLAAVVVCGLAWLGWPKLQAQFHPRSDKEPEAARPAPPQVALAEGEDEALRLPPALAKSPRFATRVVAAAPPPEPLRLSGSLIQDPNRYVRVHSLFAGQVVKIGLKGELSKTSERLSEAPENGLRVGDPVRKGQILAVLHSKEAGVMKTDLVNAIVKLRNDRAILDNYLKAQKEAPGVLTDTTLRQQQQATEADLNAVRNAERALRSAQFTEEEIAVVRGEGEKIRELDRARDAEVDRTWAEVPIRAPYDGTIVESNISIGQVVDPSTDLVKIASLDRLQVLANVYEEDLPRLLDLVHEAERAEQAALPPGGAGGSAGLEGVARAAGDAVRGWTVSYTSGLTEAGSFEKVGAVIDPMQRTGTVAGWVDNSRRKLVIGQFVTVTIPLRPDPALVGVPTSALVESPDGPRVFVEKAPGVFARRPVVVAVRGREVSYLRRPSGALAAVAGPAAAFDPVAPGMVVLARGAVELDGELETLQGDHK